MKNIARTHYNLVRAMDDYWETDVARENNKPVMPEPMQIDWKEHHKIQNRIAKSYGFEVATYCNICGEL